MLQIHNFFLTYTFDLISIPSSSYAKQHTSITTGLTFSLLATEQSHLNGSPLISTKQTLLANITSQISCANSTCFANETCLLRPNLPLGYACPPTPNQSYGIVSALTLITSLPSFTFLEKESALVTQLAVLALIDPERIVISAIPINYNQTQVTIGILPANAYNISTQASSRDACNLLVQQLNSGQLNGSSNLGVVEYLVVLSDETIIYNCNFEWQYSCNVPSVGLTNWMQAVLVIVLIVICLIFVYACCCRNSTLFFVYDKPTRTRTQRDLDGVSEKGKEPDMDGSSKKNEIKHSNSSPASPSGNKSPNSPPSQLPPAQNKKVKKKETKQGTPQSGKREGINTDGQWRNDDEASPRSHNERDNLYVV